MDHVASLLPALDRRALRRAHLVALGSGARVALAFAARHPDRVRSLVLSDPEGVEGSAPARCPVLIVVTSAGHGGDATLVRWASSFPDARAVVIPRRRGPAHRGDDTWSDVVRHFLDFVAAG